MTAPMGAVSHHARGNVLRAHAFVATNSGENNQNSDFGKNRRTNHSASPRTTHHMSGPTSPPQKPTAAA